jgi:hypothetical protein
MKSDMDSWQAAMRIFSFFRTAKDIEHKNNYLGIHS